MENLVAVPPRELEFADIAKAPMSSSKIVSIKPTTGTNYTNASSSDSIQFKLPSNGVLKTSSMYLQYKITATATDGGSGGITAVGAVLDEHAPDASPFARVKVMSSDGTQVSDTQNYNTYCSVMNRLRHTKEYKTSRGSILNGHGVDVGEGLNSATGNFNNFIYSHEQFEDGVLSADTQSIGIKDGSSRNYRMLTQGINSNASGVQTGLNAQRKVVHQIQSGFLDHESGFYLPVFAMGAGYQLHLDLANANDICRVVGSNVAQKSGGATDTMNNGCSVSYSLSDVELVCELCFYESSVLSQLSQMMCEGLKLRHPRVRSQINAITSASNVVQLNEHGRSINYCINGLRSTSNTGSVTADQNDFLYSPDSTRVINEFQFQIGSEVVPTQPIKYGPQSYMELERALRGNLGSKFQISNSVNNLTYTKDKDQGVKVSGDALFGVSFQSHPDKPSILSGKSSSAGSIPLSLQLELSGSPSNTELVSFVVSDQITELLHDGSVVLSR